MKKITTGDYSSVSVSGHQMMINIAKGDIANNYSPIKCLTNLKVSSIEQSLDANLPTLSRIKIEKGDEYVKSYIMAWIIVLNDQLNVKRKLTETQVMLTASMIFDNFPFYKISDLKLIFTGILSGEYNLYEGIDTPKIMNIFYEYKMKRMAAAYDRVSFPVEDRPRTGLISIKQAVK